MISDYEAGRTQLQPNTTSFNTVMDALAKSKEEEAEHRAEGWLQKMENLSSMDESLSMICKPDEVVRSIVKRFILSCMRINRAHLF